MKRLALITLLIAPCFASAQEDTLDNRPIDGIVEKADFRLTASYLEVCWQNDGGKTCRTMSPWSGSDTCPTDVLGQEIKGYLERNFSESIANATKVRNVRDFAQLQPLQGKAYVAILECRPNGRPTGIYAMLVDHRLGADLDNFKPDAIYKLARLRKIE